MNGQWTFNYIEAKEAAWTPQHHSKIRQKFRTTSGSPRARSFSRKKKSSRASATRSAACAAPCLGRKVEKNYEFEGPAGKVSLSDLFGGRSQLVIYHFMLGPGWKEGCPSCSYISDHFDGMTIHLANRDVTLAVVSRAPIAEIESFKHRMGWKFRWVSSNASDFNFDYQVSITPEEVGKKQVYYNYEMMEFPAEERPGLSVFAKDASGAIFHTYSSYARGLDILVGAYNFLDLVPKGRDEAGSNTPWLGFAITTSTAKATLSIPASPTSSRRSSSPKRAARAATIEAVNPIPRFRELPGSSSSSVERKVRNRSAILGSLFG